MANMELSSSLRRQEPRLGPRINLRRDVPRHSLAFLSRLLRRSQKDCIDTQEENTCSKPISSSVENLPIILGTIIPACIAVLVLIYLHRRNLARVRAEDQKDGSLDLDFGIVGNVGKKGNGQARSLHLNGEKQTHKINQLSMDMNLSSPYLLSTACQQSHESIHSLARTFPNEYDPYRLVPQYSGSDAGSLRSFSPGGANSKHNSALTGRSIAARIPPQRGASLPRPSAIDTEPSSPDEKADPFATPTAPEPSYQLPAQDNIPEAPLPLQPIMPEIGSTIYPDDEQTSHGLDMPDFPAIESPPPVLAKNRQSRLFSHPPDQDEARMPPPDHDTARDETLVASDSFRLPPIQGHEATGLGLNLDIPEPMSPTLGQHDVQLHSHQSVGGHDNPDIQTTEYYDDSVYGHEQPGIAQTTVGDNVRQPNGLAVPQQEVKRLSVGMRPLPPDEVMESEDPEYRANRIRSFYKEYFEDSKEPSEPVPPMPGQYQSGQYQEDYDDYYYGDAAYFDADSNAFVMPYAQPVTRRAMTPPPSNRPHGSPGPRGPRGGQRGPHGSVGGMSMSGAPGRPRAGSAFGRPPHPFSPRPGSSASARGRRAPPKKKGPPPVDLHTLPTPGKLKDDSFALLNAMDFAPPTTLREHQAGRSQSPLGERRPYSPMLPVASPLVTAFDELAALPSPHSLRKSSTFTGLDFAPPKKFKDNDTMSDAGSIRSNGSGISALQLGAIRSGAGRVSRLPEDMVFTTAAEANQLKPQWGMRQ